MTADHPVVILTDTRKLTNARLCNISQTGMLLLTRRHFDARPGDFLYVQFSLPGDRRSATQALPARVVHRTGDGLGLRVDLSQPLAAERMRELLTYCQK